MPDPKYDEIKFIVLSMNYLYDYTKLKQLIIINKTSMKANKIRSENFELVFCENEKMMIDELIKTIREYDVDIISGYEINRLSLGYLVQRCLFKYNKNLCLLLSRTITNHYQKNIQYENEYYHHKSTFIKITGRYVLNIWRIIRSKLDKLKSYDFENALYSILRIRFPYFTFETLKKCKIESVLWYYSKKMTLLIDLLNSLQLIETLIEFSIIYGIDLSSVLNRGSQYKVESILIRYCKRENYLLYTPSRKQKELMEKPSVIPLVMEPLSGMYTSPVIVLDYQSMYPSIMIAYNYCYSTILGNAKKDFYSDKLLKMDIKKDINISPNGIVYASRNVAEGILGNILKQLISQRLEIKQKLKNKDISKNMRYKYEAQQLGLKLISNVVYGYTAARVTGRMPCTDLSDSIIATSRGLLFKTIEHIENNDLIYKYPKVIYGDTDSLFILLRGTKDIKEAFDIANSMVNNINKLFKEPIKIKLEKIYNPSVLVKKKHYLGMKFFDSSCTGTLETKGLENIRRDICPATKKLLEESVLIYFNSLSSYELKRYLSDQWAKLKLYKIKTSDFIISKQVKIKEEEHYDKKSTGTYMAVQNVKSDHQLVPQYGELAQYIIIKNDKEKLCEMIVGPSQAIKHNYKVNVEYYAKKLINPCLNRIFKLVGIDILEWYNELSHIPYKNYVSYKKVEHGKASILKYYSLAKCQICNTTLTTDYSARFKICIDCKQNTSFSVFLLKTKRKKIALSTKILVQKCNSCSPLIDHNQCEANDCVLFFEKHKLKEKIEKIRSSCLEW